MNLYKYTAVFTPEPREEDVYNVTFPSFPEIATFGESKEEARFMAQDALELSVISRLEEGEKLPLDKKPSKLPKNAFVEEILVTIAHEVRAMPLTHDVKAAFA
ncbi:type II toxin-antitoxin system HicB family antitoxin [Candidatus Gottesmanbacteria bacterium]|nr:type II toxin-antitoxin system HicB family antitoxin [Candidatus Gottesmanbacteria bacterium]